MADVVLPFYLVCDQSFTMLDHGADLDEGLRQLVYAITTDPVAVGRTRLAIIGFSAIAEVLLPLTALDVGLRRRRLRPSASARFGDAFRLLRSTIERDVQTLRNIWHQVARPTVFFLSSGQPTDPTRWPAVHARLLDREWASRPTIVAFGIGDVDASTMTRVGNGSAFLSEPDTRPAVAVQAFTDALAGSILTSGAATAEYGRGVLRVPERVAGYTAIRRRGAAAPPRRDCDRLDAQRCSLRRFAPSVEAHDGSAMDRS